jgi:hypothetical protein
MSVSGEDMRDFFLTLRRALYLVIRWIERRYGTAPADPPDAAPRRPS